MTKKTNVKDENLFWPIVPGGKVYHNGKGFEAGVEDTWSHCLFSQKTKSRQENRDKV